MSSKQDKPQDKAQDKPAVQSPSPSGMTIQSPSPTSTTPQPRHSGAQSIGPHSASEASATLPKDLSQRGEREQGLREAHPNPLPPVGPPAPSVPPNPASFLLPQADSIGDGGTMYTVRIGIEPEVTVNADSPEEAVEAYKQHLKIRSVPSDIRPIIFQIQEDDEDSPEAMEAKYARAAMRGQDKPAHEQGHPSQRR